MAPKGLARSRSLVERAARGMGSFSLRKSQSRASSLAVRDLGELPDAPPIPRRSRGVSLGQAVSSGGSLKNVLA